MHPGWSGRDVPSDVSQGKTGPQLHSLFSELFHRVQPSDSNECWLWPLELRGLWRGWTGGRDGEKKRLCVWVCVHTCSQRKKGSLWHVCVCTHSPPSRFSSIVTTPILQLYSEVVRAGRGAQSTVDGFYVIHTKLTDSVECSPRWAGPQWVRESEQSWQMCLLRAEGRGQDRRETAGDRREAQVHRMIEWQN